MDISVARPLSVSSQSLGEKQIANNVIQKRFLSLFHPFFEVLEGNLRKNEGIMLASNLISMYCSHCKVLGYRYFIFPLTDMERVLARQEKNPHVLNEVQLSIRIYDEFLESEEGVVPDDSGGLKTPAGEYLLH